MALARALYAQMMLNFNKMGYACAKMDSLLIKLLRLVKAVMNLVQLALTQYLAKAANRIWRKERIFALTVVKTSIFRVTIVFLVVKTASHVKVAQINAKYAKILLN